jgi:hypothetical protein
MTDTPLKHRKCMGSLAVNLTNRFTISSPSIAISPEGMTIGVLEIKEKGSNAGNMSLICLKCSKDVDSQDTDSMVSRCVFCGEINPIENIFFSHQIGGTCGNCLKILRGESTKNENPELVNLLSCFSLPKEGFDFVSLATIMKKSKS